MSARQPFRPTPRPDSQLPSPQADPKGFQRIDADLGNTAKKSFDLTGLFNQKKRDLSLPTRKSKSHDEHQVPPQSISNNSWSASSHASKLDVSPAPSPILHPTTSGLGTYQSSGMPSAHVENIPSSPIVDDGSVAGTFFAQEANHQHLLPMINEADEDIEMVNDSTTGSASHFFTGRYSDSFNSRKRTQRVDEDLDNIGNINAKRFKPEQVGAQNAVRCHWMNFATAVSQAGVRVCYRITPSPLHACCAFGTAQDEPTRTGHFIGARFGRIHQRESEELRGSEGEMGKFVYGRMESWRPR